MNAGVSSWAVALGAPAGLTTEPDAVPTLESRPGSVGGLKLTKTSLNGP
jgi:hypothetical protein